MPDVPYPKPVPPTRREVAAARASDALGNVRRLISLTLTGYPDRSARRGALYIIAAGGIGIAMSVNSVVPSVIALIAVMLLALTDAVVEL